MLMSEKIQTVLGVPHLADEHAGVADEAAAGLGGQRGVHPEASARGLESLANPLAEIADGRRRGLEEIEAFEHARALHPPGDPEVPGALSGEPSAHVDLANLDALLSLPGGQLHEDLEVLDVEVGREDLRADVGVERHHLDVRARPGELEDPVTLVRAEAELRLVGRDELAVVGVLDDRVDSDPDLNHPASLSRHPVDGAQLRLALDVDEVDSQVDRGRQLLFGLRGPVEDDVPRAEAGTASSEQVEGSRDLRAGAEAAERPQHPALVVGLHGEEDPEPRHAGEGLRELSGSWLAGCSRRSGRRESPVRWRAA